MSYSTIYGIKKDFTGEGLQDFKNSWLFAPMVWEVLCDKYIPELLISHPNSNFKKSLVMNSDELWAPLNERINKSDYTYDRICWELSQQQIFFCKDKKVVANGIREFVKENREYDKNKNGEATLTHQHIIDRFEQIAVAVETMNEGEYEYFVLKGTSCDDWVEFWFINNDGEDRSLADLTEHVAEFVVIQDDKITNFVSNLDFCKADKEEI